MRPSRTPWRSFSLAALSEAAAGDESVDELDDGLLIVGGEVLDLP
jgi:hypothetical protein